MLHLLACLTLVYLQGVVCLREVSLIPIPDQAVEKGKTVTLVCLYDLEGAQLYMVTWYRGNRQVYRYLPLDQPHSKIFPFPGISIDVSMSNSSQLVMREVGLNVSGKWTCEVTTEAPHFSTSSASAFLTVIELSGQGPELVAEKRRYETGEVLRANCSALPTKPPTNLTFILNHRPISRGKIVKTTYSGGDKSQDGSWAWLEIELNPEDTRKGFMVLECEASVAGAHRRIAYVHLATTLKEPRPQRVRLMSSEGEGLSAGWLAAASILVLLR